MRRTPGQVTDPALGESLRQGFLRSAHEHMALYGRLLGARVQGAA
ncbi:hypothetical protein [Stigmatella hybrida]|nr:hypothetical protein [Stigmatella hybrida]